MGMKTWLGAVVGMLLAVQSALADMPVPYPPDTHHKSEEGRVDVAAFEQVELKIHRVTKGETLSAIARAYMGSASRWREILRFNPGVEPERLRIGTRLWIPIVPETKPPPKDVAADAPPPPTPWLFAVVRALPWKLHPHHVRHTNSLTLRAGEFLVALRYDRMPELLEILGTHQGPREGLLKAIPAELRTAFAWTSPAPFSWERVSDDDPVYRIEVNLRLVGMKDGVMELEEISRVVYGKGDQVLENAGREDEARGGVAALSGPGGRWDLVFAFLGLIALLGVAIRLGLQHRTSRPAHP